MKIKLSKSKWQSIGKQTGWIKISTDSTKEEQNLLIDGILNKSYSG
ncbi:MAG: hypothetical protein WC119_00970 [Synergistaceae bacterium]